MLRVKQAQNPNFTFLMPHDPLHPYFEWLLDNNPSEVSFPSLETFL